MLIKYVRDRKNKPIGCVVAIDKDKLGWSLCNRRDKWNRKVAVELAKKRAIENHGIKIIPITVVSEYKIMSNRARKYFKEDFDLF